MNFYKLPFIWLTIPFCIGISTTRFFSVPPNYTLLLSIIVLASLFLVFKTRNHTSNPILQHVVQFLSFYLLGNCIMGIELTEQHLPSVVNTSSQTYIGSVEESTTTKSGYIKYIINSKNNSPKNKTNKLIKKLVFVKSNNQNLLFAENSIVIFHCNFSKIKNIGYPGEFDNQYYWQNKGIYEIGFISDEANIKCVRPTKKSPFSLSVLRNKLTNILKNNLDGQELALANALILGERNLVTNETSQAFSDTGAMHILAVSGLHIGILLQIIMQIFKFFKAWITKNQATILSLILVWIYALVTGFSPSVIRSVIMFSLVLIGNMKGKEKAELNILAFSAFVILCWKPLFLFDVGFQLSYTAMIGIYLFYPFLKNVVFSRYKLIQMIIEGSMVGIAAQITTVPLTLYYFHQFPNYFLLTNIALMAFSFSILAVGLLLFSLFWIPTMQAITATILQKIMTLMLLIVDFFSKLPFATAKGFELNKFTVLLAYAGILFLFYALIVKKINLVYTALICNLCLSGCIFQKRLENCTKNTSYTHTSYPIFQIQKVNHLNYFLFPSYSWKSNKTKRIMKDFKTLYPGKSILVPLEKIIPNTLNY